MASTTSRTVEAARTGRPQAVLLWNAWWLRYYGATTARRPQLGGLEEEVGRLAVHAAPCQLAVGIQPIGTITELFMVY